MEKISLLNVKYFNLNKELALQEIIKFLRQNKKINVFFLNIDCLYKAQKDEEYRGILNSADLVLPDGIGLRILTRLYGKRMKENCNGTDFSPLLMKELARLGCRVYFLGGKKGVAEKAAQNIKRKIPNLQIVGIHHGYFEDDDEVINEINSSQADVLFVGMGVPKQEKWIFRNREKLNPKICIGVGALFNYLSGYIPRAPKFLQKIGLEWFWRVLTEPKRLWKRYLVDDMRFLVKIILTVILKKKENR